MINRELIRLKTVQVLYAYHTNGGKSIDTTEKELFHSLAQSYELYQQMFVLMIALSDIASRIVETQAARANRLGDSAVVSTKIAHNRFIAQLKQNEQLRKFRDTRGNVWLNEEEEFLRRLYGNISTRDFFVDYMGGKDSSYEEDREVWRKIYRYAICNNNELDDILEGMNLYWNDDKAIVDTFVLKTIRRFEAANGSGQELLPDFDSEEDREFAGIVLRDALVNGDEYKRLISEHANNWELDRIVRMDLVIMQVAIAEMLSMPKIPLSVSINEYVEITKNYSTPRSGGYVNGILDALARRFVAEGRITGKTLAENKEI